MDALSKYACRVANKVALNMRYGETTGAREPATRMVQDAIDATCDLLDRINPVELRNWFEQFQTVYLGFRSDLIDDPDRWSRFLGSQCELLHDVQLHQKTIANIGDDLASWDRDSVTFDEFANSLDGLAGLVSEHAAVLRNAIEGEAGRQASPVRRSDLFTDSVCGLTIVTVAIDQSKQIGNPRDQNNAALAIFGASLTNVSVKQLFKACELTWTL